MPENDISCLRYNSPLLTEADQVQRFIFDYPLDQERCTEHFTQLTQAASTKMRQCSF